MTRATLRLAIGCAVWLSAFGTQAAAAGPRVDLVVGHDAPRLERLAAEELRGQLQRLYDADVQIHSQWPDSDARVILLGSPQTNPTLHTAIGDRWPELSGQGHCLRSIEYQKRPALIVGGGSPVATLWAAHELAHRFGMRSLLHGDYPPITPVPLTVENFDAVLEPTVRVRAWRLMGDSLIGTQGWGIAEHQQLLRQLAKQKFNRIVIDAHAWQPFVHFAHADIEKKSGVLFAGWRFPVAGDTPGRAAFRGAEYFDNPEFADATTYPQRRAAGEKLLHGVIDGAKEVGMDVVLQIRPFEFPAEFAPAMADTAASERLEHLSVVPGAKQDPRDARLIAVAAAQLRAYLMTYPQIDAVYLDVSGVWPWKTQASSEWQRLEKELGFGDFLPLPNGFPAAQNPAVQSQVVALSFVYGLLQQQRDVLVSNSGAKLPLGVAGLDPALGGLLPHLLPSGAEAVWTAVDDSTGIEGRPPAQAGMFSPLWLFPLGNEQAGVLPQMSTASIGELLKRVRQAHGPGYVVASEAPGDLSPTAYYLSRASFDGDLTSAAAVDELVTTICGEGVASRVSLGFEILESATREASSRIGSAQPDMILRHYAAQAPPPEEWARMLGAYTETMNEMYRGNTRARQGGRSFSLYYAKKNEFGLHYMTCLDAVRKAGQAEPGSDERIAGLEQAVEAMYSALSALSEVARDPSDRATIAVLNEFAFRQLLKELDAAQQ
jgi:hypothetical protein